MMKDKLQEQYAICSTVFKYFANQVSSHLCMRVFEVFRSCILLLQGNYMKLHPGLKLIRLIRMSRIWARWETTIEVSHIAMMATKLTFVRFLPKLKAGEEDRVRDLSTQTSQA